VYGGLDPVTGKQVYLRETIQGTDRAAARKARGAMARLVAQVDSQRSPRSSANWHTRWTSSCG
jgi:integrase